jgi:protease I
MAVILIPLPRCDFDPTESGVPWRLLRGQGHRIVFATPDGQPGEADPKTLNGQGLGPFAALLRADANGASAYEDMRRSREFQHPIPYQDIRGAQVDALLLPGGHAPGMRPYLESAWLQLLIAEMFEQGRPVGAICHGVLLVARSRNRTGRSVLHGRTTTGLTRSMELCGWALTRFTVGSIIEPTLRRSKTRFARCWRVPTISSAVLLRGVATRRHAWITGSRYEMVRMSPPVGLVTRIASPGDSQAFSASIVLKPVLPPWRRHNRLKIFAFPFF